MRALPSFAVFLTCGLLATHCRAAVEQVRIALTGVQGQLLVSWVTSDHGAKSTVKVGSAPAQYDGIVYIDVPSPSNLSVVGIFTSNDTKSYSIGDYTSGDVHFVTVTGLQAYKKYYYVCGDDITGFSNEYSFVTPHDKPTKVSFGLIGDLGQTKDSKLTASSMSKDPEGIDLILHVGDLSYADGDQHRWDKWGRMFEYLAATVPWMVFVGNHENEDVGTPFLAYQTRFRMPVASSIDSDRSLYWSMDYSWAHIIALSTESDYSTSSEQYKWFVNDLKSIDRNVTPWVIVMFHRPFYNSNYAHQGEVPDFRPIYEPLFGQYCVDIVLSGHVHSYERTKPVFNNKVGSNQYPQYFNIGDGGNREGLQYSWYSTPQWSAFHKAAYGYSRMDMLNETHMQHSWFANDYEYVELYKSSNLLTPLESHVASDSVLIVKDYPRTCTVKAVA